MAANNTIQGVLNTVWEEFVVRGRAQAVDEAGSCVYRGVGDEGCRDSSSPTRCFLGVCIPDDMYTSAIEMKGALRLKNVMPEWYDKVFNGIDVHQLAALQKIHDEGDGSPSRMKAGLVVYAEDNHLVIPATKE